MQFKTTDRPVTPVEEMVKEYRAIELPGTHDAQGMPWVVRIQRLCKMDTETITKAAKDGGDSDRLIASLGLVEPKYTDAIWEALSDPAQIYLSAAIAAFTSEGMSEVRNALEIFRAELPEGNAAGNDGLGGGTIGGVTSVAARDTEAGSSELPGASEV